MRNDNLKKTGQLRNVWVELGFGTVWPPVSFPQLLLL